MNASRLDVAGGVWRLACRRHFTRGHALALAILLALFALVLFAFLRSANGPREYQAFSANFYFTFLLPLLAFVGAGGAWRDELKPEAADYFLLRGVPKPRYLVLRYCAHLVCAEADFAFALALLCAVGSGPGVHGLAAALPVMLATQILGVAAFSALGFFFATLTSRWVVLGLVYGALVEVGISNVPLAVNRIALTHQLRDLLEGRAPAWAAGGLVALAAAVLVAAAAARFSGQELTGEKASD